MLDFLGRASLVFVKLALVLALCAACLGVGAVLGSEIGIAIGWMVFASFVITWCELDSY